MRYNYCEKAKWEKKTYFFFCHSIPLNKQWQRRRETATDMMSPQIRIFIADCSVRLTTCQRKAVLWILHDNYIFRYVNTALYYCSRICRHTNVEHCMNQRNEAWKTGKNKQTEELGTDLSWWIFCHLPLNSGHICIVVYICLSIVKTLCIQLHKGSFTFGNLQAFYK